MAGLEVPIWHLKERKDRARRNARPPARYPTAWALSVYLGAASPKRFRHRFAFSYPFTVPEETDLVLLETVHALPAEAQRAVLSYARFLREEEERCRLRENEAGWDERCNDPGRMARFASWAEKSMAGDPLEPLDRSTL